MFLPYPCTHNHAFVPRHNIRYLSRSALVRQFRVMLAAGAVFASRRVLRGEGAPHVRFSGGAVVRRVLARPQSTEARERRAVQDRQTHKSTHAKHTRKAHARATRGAWQDGNYGSEHLLPQEK